MALLRGVARQWGREHTTPLRLPRFHRWLILTALVRHLRDSILAALGRPPHSSNRSTVLKRKALLVVLLHFVLELAPVHLRYRPAVPRPRSLAQSPPHTGRHGRTFQPRAGAKDGGSPAQWWTRFP